ncbi:hypothetical protein BN946_scf184573.g4 [Trametes cinnabarina]|uniref:Ubiquitin 3 binding protein But2 C-terminal domain-containing protein n=1 Tax=Pycnoporus cinnabarinus TaxID=5643 RepID=A0A060S8G5_PYCCI|nr:hypothetical protein BN946_scf184573.g4 [Trametes cinnabarina]
MMSCLTDHAQESERLLHSSVSFALSEGRNHEYDEPSPENKPLWAQPSGRSPTVVTVMFILLAVVASTDLIALFYMSRILNTAYADLGTAGLEYANPYHGLAELYSSGAVQPPTIKPLLNTPRVVAQVFSDRPEELAPIGEHDLFTKAFGTLSPHEKHLQVTVKTNTIAQFRTVDFGMEECSLVFRLPGSGHRIESKEPFQFDPRSVFDIYRLESSKPLDVRTLSYRTRPPMKEKVATISPRAGEDTLITHFPCSWSSLHTFEVACAEGSNCLVDVWSSQNTTWGIYMFQHQTI